MSAGLELEHDRGQIETAPVPVDGRGPWQPVEHVISAICYSIVRERDAGRMQPTTVPTNAIVNFVLAQQQRMTDWLRGPLRAVTHLFDWSAVAKFGHRFHRLGAEQRAAHLAAWRESPLGPQRDLVRFYESLVTVAMESRDLLQPSPAMVPAPKHQSRGSSDGRGAATWTEVAVIGSGPGGAVTACLLSEAGREVTLIEEGRHLEADRPRQFSIGEMAEKYRNGGVTALLGNPKIAYVEGRCVGGGSEINSGLYHRTPPEALERWRTEFLVQDLDEQTLRPHFEQCERDVCVSSLPGEAPAASSRLDAGARQLGWKSLEVPRWISFDTARDAGNRSAGAVGLRQTMSRTYIPRALAAGCQLVAETRVTRLRRLPQGWAIEMTDSSGRESRLNAETIFVACGAIHSPALLQRSGLGSHAGRSLHVHPTAKLVAEFEEQVNGWNSGVGVHQVKEFSPRLGFGCSVASPPHLGLAMLDHPRETRRLEDCWPNMAVYYAMTTGGRGSVRALPGFRDPLVRFRLAEPEMRDLADGLWKLSEALFAAGATTLFPAVRGAAAVRGRRELSQIPALLSRGAANLMTIHLFSTCPMGEDHRRCTADSYGKVHGEQNLYLADASLLCTAPGVNPQGSIMAIARRNALHFLANS